MLWLCPFMAYSPPVALKYIRYIFSDEFVLGGMPSALGCPVLSLDSSSCLALYWLVATNQVRFSNLVPTTYSG